MRGKIKLFCATLALMLAYLLPADAHAEKVHIAITCPSEDAYIRMTNQAKAMMASGLETHDNFMTIVANNGCTDDHVQPGQPPYQIQDFDGDFVVISNGTISGYMNKHDYDTMYVIGQEQSGN